MAQRRGTLLLEVLLSLALFIAAGGAVLSIVSQGVGSLKSMRDKLHAADLARSTMAEIEAGITTVEVANGPVAVWKDESEGAAETERRVSGWELRIQTSPTTFEGLTLVTITAVRVEPGDQSSAYTLSQLVRLGREATDTIGDVDDVTRAAERGAAEQPRRARDERGREGRR